MTTSGWCSTGKKTETQRSFTTRESRPDSHNALQPSCWGGADTYIPHSHVPQVKVAQLCGSYSPRNSSGQNSGIGSLSLLQGIFPTQGSNPGLLHCRRILYQLSHQPPTSPNPPRHGASEGLWPLPLLLLGPPNDSRHGLLGVDPGSLSCQLFPKLHE